MYNTIESNLNGNGLKFCLVVSRFNDFITSRLLDGAVDCLKRHEVESSSVDVVWVPGAYEIPLMAKKISKVNIEN